MARRERALSNKSEVGNVGGEGGGDGESEDHTSTRRSERRLRHSRLAGVRRRTRAHKRKERNGAAVA